jgi:hypothetical protein
MIGALVTVLLGGGVGKKVKLCLTSNFTVNFSAGLSIIPCYYCMVTKGSGQRPFYTKNGDFRWFATTEPSDKNYFDWVDR